MLIGPATDPCQTSLLLWPGDRVPTQPFPLQFCGQLKMTVSLIISVPSRVVGVWYKAGQAAGKGKFLPLLVTQDWDQVYVEEMENACTEAEQCLPRFWKVLYENMRTSVLKHHELHALGTDTGPKSECLF